MTRAEYQAYLASREWALKREAVRERSADRCERCWTRRMDAVHHKTYERVGNEWLEDLQGICDPCHEYLSGKRPDDPATGDVAVYLAGPFTKPDWRREMLSRLPDPMDTDSGPPWCFPIVPQALPGGFSVTGPWRIEEHGDHGILDASGHPSWTGRWNGGSHEIVRLCRKALDDSDFVFVWLPEPLSVPAGTLWELGYAAARGKPVVMARPRMPGPSDDDYWFPSVAADFNIPAACPAKAWRRLTEDDCLPRLLRLVRR